jgi:hypothetical protein
MKISLLKLMFSFVVLELEFEPTTSGHELGILPITLL